MKYSVILPAFDVDSFIEECVSSILDIVSDAEVLIGVDGCPSTHNKVKEMLNRYPIKGFYFPVNYGPYIVRNTLVNQAVADYLIFFDADDVMLPPFISWCDKHYASTTTFTRFKYIRVNEKTEPIENIGPVAPSGIFGIRKAVFKEFGGFKHWPIRADVEFRERITRKLKGEISPQPSFLWRKQKKSLTQRADTGYGSELRKKYREEMMDIRKNPIKETSIDPVVGEFQKIE